MNPRLPLWAYPLIAAASLGALPFILGIQAAGVAAGLAAGVAAGHAGAFWWMQDAAARVRSEGAQPVGPAGYRAVEGAGWQQPR